MKFYLGIRLPANEVQVEVRPQITETLDESFDSASVTLKANSRDIPYEPNTKFVIDMETSPNKVFVFIIENDSVELYSTKPLLYKHTLTLVQNTKLLKNYLVRNSSFTTSPNKDSEKGYYSRASALQVGSGQRDYERDLDYKLLTSYGTSWNMPVSLSLSYPSKRSKVFLKVEVRAAGYKQSYQEPYNHIWFNGSNTFTNVAELNSFFGYRAGSTQGNLRTPFLANNNVTIKYGHVTETKTLTQLGIETPIVFGKEYRVPYIENLISQGYDDISVRFAPVDETTTGVWFSGLNTPIDANYPMPHFISQSTTISVNTKAYSCYEVLQLLLKRYARKSSEYSGYQYPFSLPTNGSGNFKLWQLLTTTDAPNFVFTQATMYECVAEIFKLFDATFTIDEYGILDIEYLNEKKTQVNLNNELVSVSQSQTSELYTNAVVAHYQDARTLEVFPSQFGYAKQRSQELGVASEDDHVILLPHKIDSIKKAELRVYSVHLNINNQNQYYACDFPLDITRWVVESSIWSSLSSSTEQPNNISVVQINSIQYSKGGNAINLASQYSKRIAGTNYNILNTYNCALNVMFGIVIGTPNASPVVQISNWFNIEYRIEYYTSVDGKVRVDSDAGKTIGETMIDQNNGAVDLNKLGSNMYGITLKTGEPKKTVTLKLRNWADRIEKGAYTQDGYVANIIKYTFYDNGIISEQIEFVKNFNALSQRVKLMREKRLTAISSELTLKSEEIITEYCRITNNSFTTSLENTCISDIDIFKKALLGTFKYRAESFDIASFYSEEESEEYGDTNYIYLPLIKYGAGTSVCFEMSFDHPINAGNQSSYEQSGWWSGTRYFTKAVPYTDRMGKFTKFNIAFWDAPDNISFDQSFPNQIDDTQYNLDLIGEIHNFEYYKQPNEIFAFNFEINFYTSGNSFIGNEFINHNGLIEHYKGKKFYLYTSYTEKYDILDKKGIVDGFPVEITDTSLTTDPENERWFKINFTLEEDITTTGLKSWSIADEDGNIYYASNDTPFIENQVLSLFITYVGRKQR